MKKCIALITLTFLLLVFGTIHTEAQTSGSIQQPVKPTIKRQDISKPKVDTHETRIGAMEQMLKNIKIANLSVQHPQKECVGEWYAGLFNPNNADLTFTVEIHQYDAESRKWEIVNSQTVTLKKNEEKSLRGNWRRMPLAQKLKLSIKGNQAVYGEKEISLPAIPGPNVEVTAIDILDTGFRAHIVNRDAVPHCRTLFYQSIKYYTDSTAKPIEGSDFEIPGNYTLVIEKNMGEGWKTGLSSIKFDIRKKLVGGSQVISTKTVPVNP